MSFFRGLKRFAKPYIDFPRWMQWSKLRVYGKDIKSLADNLFSFKNNEQQKESFNQACKRFGLTEKELLERLQGLKRILIFNLVAGFLVFIYSIYLFSLGYFRGGASGIAVTSTILAFAFRQHFWMTQIRLGQLGLSFKDWRKSIFAKGSNS